MTFHSLVSGRKASSDRTEACDLYQALVKISVASTLAQSALALKYSNQMLDRTNITFLRSFLVTYAYYLVGSNENDSNSHGGTVGVHF